MLGIKRTKRRVSAICFGCSGEKNSFACPAVLMKLQQKLTDEKKTDGILD